MDTLDAYIRDLKRVAGTNGGEYAGPCPWCGGEDRFRVWPSEGETGAYWCRQCDAKGDGIDYLRDAEELTFVEACEALHVEHKIQGGGAGREASQGSARECATPRRRPVGKTPKRTAPPNPRWRSSAAALVERCANWLWTDRGAGALKWLRGRGFRDSLLKAARIGYHPNTEWEDRSTWGLPETDQKKHQVLPDGVVIPWIIEGDVWKVNIRLGRETRAWYREQGEAAPGYRCVKGSRNALYGANLIRPERPVVLVEGEFDALTIQQEARGLATAVATGSTAGARRLRWKVRLMRASSVLVAFDSDPPGEKAAQYWIDELPNAKRWRPYWGDVNDLLTDGEDVGEWVRAGLGKAAPVAA